MRILITGMSGVGKSTVTRELCRRGRRAVDLDGPDWSEWVDADPSDHLTPVGGRDWVWRAEKVAALLAGAAHGELFVSGCAENMSAVYPLIDLVVLLSAPRGAIMARLSARSEGRYGASLEDREKVSALIATVEPRLRMVADREVAASAPLETVVDEILRLADDQAFRSGASPEVAGRAPPGAAGQRRLHARRRASR